MKNQSAGEIINPNKAHAFEHRLMNLLILVMLFLYACTPGGKQGDEGQADTEDQLEEQADNRTAKAEMKPCSDSQAKGEATFKEENGAVVFELTIENLTPGEHGVHLHEKGDCSAGDGSSAGGHWNPSMKPHGKRGGGPGFHRGDVANISIDHEGKGTLKLSIDDWTIGGPDSTNVIGKSVIVHGNPDDFTSQPAGNAGSRISCGEIKAD